MRAGELDQVLVLESPTYTRNGDGSETITYSDHSTVFGKVRPVSGREFIANRQVTADTTYQITIRYVEGVKASWRIRHEHASRTYNIQNILPTEGKKIELVIYGIEATT
jgi:SPP1 family predicted phage head-tail adaptor